MNGTSNKLQMVWPEHQLDILKPAPLARGYSLRTHQPEDESRFYEIMALSGWKNWNGEVLQRWRHRLLPEGWFVVFHNSSQKIVFSAMALQSNAYPSGGELGWLASDPAHSGRGLGMAISAAVTLRMLQAGCRPIHLYTEDFRLAALKIYLKLGYVPLLYLPEMQARWKSVCNQLAWPNTPEAWQSSVLSVA